MRRPGGRGRKIVSTYHISPYRNVNTFTEQVRASVATSKVGIGASPNPQASNKSSHVLPPILPTTGLDTTYSNLNLSSSRSDLYIGRVGGPLSNSRINYRWDKVEKLKIEDYSRNLENDVLLRCRHRLRVIEFIGLTTLNNIYMLLTLCRNLRQLTLNNVYLHYFENYDSFPRVSVGPDLTEIVFAGPSKLSLDELQLLDFFHMRIVFVSLNTLSFRLRTREQNAQDVNQSLMHSGEDPKNSLHIFTTFVRETNVTHLEVERPFIQLMLPPQPEGSPTPPPPTNSSNATTITIRKSSPKPLSIFPLILEKLVANLNTSDIERILLSQRKLRSLYCYNNTCIPFKVFDQAAITVMMCENTLEEIRFNHKYISDGTLSAGSTDTPIQHDLRTYKNCRALKKLNLDISMTEHPDKFRVHPGELLHFNSLPNTLQTLILRFDIVQPRNMEGISWKFAEMKRLKYFIFHGNPLYVYPVSYMWVDALVRLPEIEIFELHFCHIVEPDSIQQLMDSIPGLRRRMEVTRVSCIYWKHPLR